MIHRSRGTEVIMHVSLGGDHLPQLATHVDHHNLVIIGAEDVGRHRIAMDVVGMLRLGC